MEAKLKDKQSVEATVEVTVPAVEVDQAFDRVLRQLSRQVRVPGFRPGKAPRGMLVKRIGEEALGDEVREELVERSYREAMKQFDLLPVHAHVHGGSPSEGQEFTFELHVDLYPEIELPPVEEIVIDTGSRQVDDEMVKSTIARLQSENATMVPVDRAVEPGDYLLVETVSEEGGEGSVMPIDLEAVGEELAQQLVGKSAGDVVSLRLGGPDAPAGAQDEAGAEAAGEAAAQDEAASEAADEADADGTDESAEARDAAVSEPPRTLEIRIKDVKAKEKPAADDEFAKTLGFDNWQETEDRIRRSLQEQLDQETEGEQREEFVDKLIASTSFELPRSLVQRRRAALLENLADDVRRRGLTLEQYFERLQENGGREEFERELQEAAEKGVRRDLVLERLLERRGTRLSEADFDGALRQLAASEGMDVERLRRERGEEWLNNYRFLLTRDRAVRETVRELLAGESAEEQLRDSPEAPSPLGEAVADGDEGPASSTAGSEASAREDSAR